MVGKEEKRGALRGMEERLHVADSCMQKPEAGLEEGEEGTRTARGQRQLGRGRTERAERKRDIWEPLPPCPSDQPTTSLLCINMSLRGQMTMAGEVAVLSPMLLCSA